VRSRTGPVVLAVVLLAAVAACDARAPEPSAASAPSTTQAGDEHAGHHGGAAPAATPAKPTELAAALEQAAAAGDDGAKQQARQALLADADAYGAWLAEASDGQASASAAAAQLKTHVQQLMDHDDAFAAKDYDRAYRVERDASEEEGAKVFKAAADQVDANSDALTKGMGAVVGPKKAAEFQSAWAEHVEGLLDYSAALASHDDAERAVVREKMRGYGARLALSLSDIVRNELPLAPITQALGEHDQHLVDQIDAYAAKRYDEAQESEVDGYGQMLGVANTPVGALQRTVKPQLPVGGSQTGGGSTANWPR